MPPPRGAQSKNAQAYVAARGAPDGLDSFLGGFVPGGAAAASVNDYENESVIAVQLKLLTKSSDITKQKALASLIARIDESTDAAVCPLATSVVEAVIQHATYPNPLVRTATFTMLKALMGHGKVVKQSIVTVLPTLTGVWVMALNDMEASVRHEARLALEIAFTAEKRPLLFAQFKDSVLQHILDSIEEALEKDSRPLQDDQLDVRSNVVFSALGALGFMAKQVSSTQSSVVVFVTEHATLARLLPAKSEEGKKSMTQKTPLVRSAALALLCDVVRVCPCKPKVHQLIAKSVQVAVADANVVVVSRAWELLLYWCKVNVGEMVNNLPAKFFDDVVDSFMNCHSTDLAEVIFPCLLPLLAQVTKDSRCAEILDEFGGALVEKLKQMDDTYNVSARDFELVLGALLECWELHCVRTRGTAQEADSEELITVILFNIVSVLQKEAKMRRFCPVVQSLLSKSLLKTAIRNEAAFKSTMRILCGLPDAHFVVLPPDATPALQQSFRRLYSMTLGVLYSCAEKDAGHTRQMAMYRAIAGAVLEHLHELKDVESMAALLVTAEKFVPSEPVAHFMIDQVTATLRSQPSAYTRGSGGGSGACADDAAAAAPDSGALTRSTSEIIERCSVLVPIILAWGYTEGSERLLAATSNMEQLKEISKAVTDHLLQDPKKVKEILLVSCESCNFDDVKRCLKEIVHRSIDFSNDEREEVKRAILQAMEATLRLVKDREDDNVDKDATSSSSSSSSRDSANEEWADDAGGASDVSSAGKREKDSQSDEEREDKEDDNSDNEGVEVLYRVAEWCSLLSSGTDLARLLQLSADNPFTVQVCTYFLKLTVRVAPRLFPEQFVSIKALRIALTSKVQQTGDDGEEEEDEEDEEEEEEDALAAAMEKKRHFLTPHTFHELRESVSQFMSSYTIKQEARDKMAAQWFDEELDDKTSPSTLAVQYLQHMLPFASQELVQHYIASAALWKRFTIQRSSAPNGGESKRAMQSSLSLFDGAFALSELELTMESTVRTAQLIRLVDYAGVTDAEPRSAARVFLFLLRASARREAFSATTNHVLFDKLLPSLFFRFGDKQLAEEFVGLLDSAEDTWTLLATLGLAIRDLAREADADAHDAFLVCGRSLISVVSASLIDSLLSASGAKGIAEEAVIAYTTFFRHMDQAANAVKDNMLIAAPKEKEQLMNEGLASLPMWDLQTAKIILIVHRHLHTLPVVSPSTVTAVIAFAQKQRPIECLELLAELSCTRVLDMAVFSDLVRAIVNALCRCYTLKHMPSNGRLQVGTGGDAPLNFELVRRVAMAAVLARHGVIIHSRMDDVLRGTVNLVIFDAVCEAISQLRNAGKGQDTLIAKLIAFTLGFLGNLSSFDVAGFRASEASVLKITQVFTFAYAWLSAAPIAKLEAMGNEAVTGVLRCACLLANLTLVGSSFSLQEAMLKITQKRSWKPIRAEYSTSNQAKLATFRRFNELLRKTHKLKLVLFPYLLAWCVHVSTPEAETVGTPVAANPTAADASYSEWRSAVYNLLDLLFALLLTPAYHNKSKRVEDSILGSAMQMEAAGKGAAVDHYGFSVATLTRVDASDSMVELGRGAATLLGYLLRKATTLSLVSGWLDTLERKSQALFFDFVSVHVTPLLIQESFNTVMQHSPDHSPSFAVGDNFTVQLSTQQRCITLVYEMEDARAAVRITFPDSFPLRQPKVESITGRESGVSSEKRRGWMLKMTVLLFGGSANIWDSIDLFRQNLDAYYTDSEPCPICFAVVNAVNHKLPDMRCSVCHNSKFHSNCLYTWWAGGGQTICPLCRSPWVAE